MAQIVERKSRSIIIDGITDREVRSRNFGGKEKLHPVTGRVVNSAGRRNFLLKINEDIANELSALGCEVKIPEPKNPNDVPEPYVSVTVSYYAKPVEAWTIANGVPTQLDEAHIYVLDSMDIQNMCLELEFGKEKQHNNGTKYIPIYANKIVCEVVPSYFNSRYGMLNNPAPGGDDGTQFAQ